MSTIQVLDRAINDINGLRRFVRNQRNERLSLDEKNTLKAQAMSWIEKTRPQLVKSVNSVLLQSIDDEIASLLELAEKSTRRSKTAEAINIIIVRLQSLRREEFSQAGNNQITPLVAPNFNSIASDKDMRNILERRWYEAYFSMEAKAYLASSVMMGSLLETVLLSLVIKYPNRSKLFKLKSTPKDKKTRKALNLSDWTLNNYLDVALEIGWIKKTTKDIGVIIRDYRNYIHPEKEYSNGITIDESDCRMFWVIFNEVLRQLVLAHKTP